jgi:hypothetical protein
VTQPDGSIQADAVERRIQWLAANRLERIASDTSGWDTLYRDPQDGRLWQLTFPNSDFHGGGPRRLTVIDRVSASLKYSLTVSITGAMIRVRDHFHLTGRGAVAACELISGTVSVGMRVVRAEELPQLTVSAVEIGDSRNTGEWWLGLMFAEQPSVDELKYILPVGTEAELTAPDKEEIH